MKIYYMSFDKNNRKVIRIICIIQISDWCLVFKNNLRVIAMSPKETANYIQPNWENRYFEMKHIFEVYLIYMFGIQCAFFL